MNTSYMPFELESWPLTFILRTNKTPKAGDHNSLNLLYPGVLNPLDSPHHMRAQDDSDYREGVVLNRPVKDGKGSFVNVGLLKVDNVDCMNFVWSKFQDFVVIWVYLFVPLSIWM